MEEQKKKQKITSEANRLMLKKLYLECNLSTADIAKEFNVSQRTIQMWVKQLGYNNLRRTVVRKPRKSPEKCEIGIVYLITFPDKHVYIGQTRDLHARISVHRSNAKRGVHGSPYVNRLAKNDSDLFAILCTDTACKVLFKGICDNEQLTDIEYNMQKNYRKLGYTVLGRQTDGSTI